MKHIKTQTQRIAAAKAGMDVKTARSYLKSGKLPSEQKKAHNWQTRKDPFEQDWPNIESFLASSPRLQAKTLLEYLVSKHPGRYNMNMLRTLQRRFQGWRAKKGPAKTVLFSQVHLPGLQSQSDYTAMGSLKITLAGQPFKHLLFHFMLVYSRWEHVSICYSESFDSLLQGFEQAAWSLGSVAQEHRTDNLSAATQKAGGRRVFTARWQQVMTHYKITPSRNNPGESHENGSIEKSHDLYKTALDQMLLLRGSRDFPSIEAYETFLRQLTDSRNASRQAALGVELPLLRQLPQDKWYSPQAILVRVSPSSTVQIDTLAYSVPSRLISYTLKAYVYPDSIELYYGSTLIQRMPKQQSGPLINYRHIIDSLIRKPGAFKHYQYRDALFPSRLFRQAYEALQTHCRANGHKLYLRLLQLAKLEGEQAISAAIKKLLTQKRTPLPQAVRQLLTQGQPTPEVTVSVPKLTVYNQLLTITH